MDAVTGVKRRYTALKSWGLTKASLDDICADYNKRIDEIFSEDVLDEDTVRELVVTILSKKAVELVLRDLGK